MSSARRITVEFIGNDKSLGKTAQGIESKTSKMGATLSKVGKMAAVGLAAGAVVAGKALWDAGQKAGDLNETMSKTNQIFGNRQGDALAKWAKGAATSLGQSQQTALDAAATFGVFGKSAGKSGKDLAAFAKENTKLATDLASFYNTSPEEAIEAIGAAFRGEAEPMRKYGVLLDDASMRQQALRMGLVKTTKEALTPQQKVLAAQALIMKQTGDAQGDFARTSGGLANQQRILKAQFENLQVTIGQKVVPILADLFKWANTKLLPGLKVLGGWIRDNLGPIFVKIGDTLRKVLGGMSGDSKGRFKELVGIFRDAVSIIRSLWARFGKTITQYLVATFKNIKTVLSGAFKIIRGIFKVFSSLLKGDWKGVWEGIKLILRGAWDVIKGIVKQLWNFVKTAFKLGGSAVKAIWSGLWDGAKTIAKNGLTWIVDGIKAIPAKIRALGGLFKEAGRWVIQSMVDGLKNAAGIVSGIAGNVWDAVRGMLNSAISKINAALSFTISLPGPNLSVNPPDIPYLAKGGLVTRPTLALIGEDGPEAVVPLSAKNAPRGGIGGLGGITVNVYGALDPNAVAKQIEELLLRRQRLTGRAVLAP